jgi:hypothetical protein
LPALGHVELQRLTHAMLGGLYQELQDKGRKRTPGGLSPATVSGVHKSLYRALGDAVRLGYVGCNVAELVHPPGSRSAEQAREEER